MIQRWTAAMGDFEAEMWRDEDGAYVLHADYELEMERLRGLLREYRTAAKVHMIGPNMCLNDEYGDTRCDLCKRTDEELK